MRRSGVAAAWILVLASVALAGPRWTPRKTAELEQVVSKHERSFIEPALDALSESDRRRVETAIEGASSDRERAYLVKALAAGNTVPGIEWLARKIRGRSPEWLDSHLALTDMRQQFRNSCTVTTLMALVALYDPVFALRVRLANADPHRADDSDPFGVNRRLARLQQRLLLTRPVWKDGTSSTRPYAALARDDAEGLGGGRAISDWLQARTVEARAHLSYGKALDDWFDADRKTLEDFLGSERLVRMLEDGLALPVEIGNQRASHEVLLHATRVRDGVREFGFFEPWEGEVVWRTREQLVHGALDILGMEKVKVVYLPERVRPSIAAESRARDRLLGGPAEGLAMPERVLERGITERLGER